MGDSTTRNGMICNQLDDEIEKYEIDRACGTFERGERCV